MQGEALNDSVADTPPQGKAKTLLDTIRDLKARSVVDTVSNPLKPAKAERNLETLGDVKAVAVVETLAKFKRREV